MERRDDGGTDGKEGEEGEKNIGKKTNTFLNSLIKLQEERNKKGR